MQNQKTGLHTGLGIGSLVVGIIALLISFIPCFGQLAIFVAPVAIVMGLGGYYLAKKTDQSSGLNLGGIIVSLIAFFIAFYQMQKQTDARNYMSKQMGGNGDDSIGYLQYILAFIVIAIVIFINYTVGKKETKPQKEVVNTDSAPNFNSADSTTSAISKLDIESFIKRNSKALVVIVLLTMVGLGGWEFFLKATPEKDAQKAFDASCNCLSSENEEVIKENEAFLSNFDSYNLKTQSEAWGKLDSIQKASSSKKLDCDNQASNLYTDLRAKYLSNAADLQKFDFVYKGKKCNTSNGDKVIEVGKKIAEKIVQIKEVQPSISSEQQEIIQQEERDAAASEASNTKKQTENAFGEQGVIAASSNKSSSPNNKVAETIIPNESKSSSSSLARNVVGKWKGYGRFQGITIDIGSDMSITCNSVSKGNKVILSKLQPDQIESWSKHFSQSLNKQVLVSDYFLRVPLELNGQNQKLSMFLINTENPNKIYTDRIENYFERLK